MLLREDGVQGQTCEIAVLQVFQLFLEHGRGLAAVAVDEGKAGKWFARQHGFHDRQNRRDAAATRNAQVVARLRGIYGYKKAAFGR